MRGSKNGVNMITYRKANHEDVRPALELSLRVFIEYEAPAYEPGAVDKFKADCVENEVYIGNYLTEKYLMFVALDGEKIVGIVNERGNGHISMMFVDGIYHRQGIATELMNCIVCELKLCRFDKVTLNSSPYGLPFYLNFGFVPTDAEQRKYKFVFTPMEYTPNEILDVLDANGDKTGRFHERGRPMTAGEYHLAVNVWKHNGRGEWLIDKRVSRSPGDVSGGKWETTGGAAIAGDDSLTAALRETKEELGIDLDAAKGVLFRRFAREGFYGHTYLMDVWVFEHDCATRDVRFGERETCDAMWVTAEQIRLLISNNEFFSDVELYFDEMVDKWRMAKA